VAEEPLHPGQYVSGVTRHRYPEAAPFDSLSAVRLLGPTQAGPSLSDRPEPRAMVAAVPNAPASTYEHEGRHVSAASPRREMGKFYTDMGPRQREEFQVFAANKYADDIHRAEDQARLEQAVQALRAKLGRRF
jgi:hypothetical protein